MNGLFSSVLLNRTTDSRILDEGIVPLEWKEAICIPLFKKVRETSHRTIDQ